MAIAVFVLPGIPSRAQYENLKFNQFDERDGLSNNNVNCLIQDADGFMWVGTDNALNRYDGYNFKHYKNIPDDSLSLIHDHILVFYISKDSTLWIGTQYGVCKYRRETDDFQQFSKGYSHGYIRGFYEDKSGRIYTVNDRGQIYLINKDNLTLSEDFNFHLYSYLNDTEGNHWFGVEKGLYFVNTLTRADTLYDISSYVPREKKDYAVFSILEDVDKVWIGTRGNGIFCIDKNSMALSVFPVKLNFIKTIQKDDLGNLLIGDTEGLKIINKKSLKTLNYKPLVERVDQHLAANAVDVILKDSQNNLWLGIKFRGLNLAYLDKGFRYIDYFSEDPFDKTKKTIISIIADTDKDFWFGSYTNGLEKVNLHSKKSVFYSCNNAAEGLQCGSVYELYRDRDSTLWIGTYDGSLQRMKHRTEKVETFSPGFSGDKSEIANDIRSICEDHEGNFWILTHGKGLARWNRKTNEIIYFRNNPADPQSLINDWAFHIICDSKGYLWVATPYGLSVSRDGQTFENYFHDAADTTSLLSNEIFTVFEDSNEQIWIGTRDGLSLYREASNDFRQYTKDEGLIDNYICSIEEDGNNNLWIATKKGLSRLNPKTGQVNNYDTGDGLQNNEFMENSSVVTPSGYMVFGSVNRGTWFHPDSLLVNTQPPRVYFTDLKLLYKPVPIEPDNEEAILRSDIRYTKQIRINYREKVISLSFVALNYIHSEKNHFAYKLENFDKDWIYLQQNREVTYTNLTPGQYTFRVKASNNDGYWNEEGAILDIIIMPPFWQTWWFRSLIAIIFFASIFFIYFLRMRSVKETNIKLEDTVKQRTRELQTKNEILAQRTQELNVSNSLLEQRQQQIIEQSKELKLKNQQLNKNSDELLEQKEILEKTNRQLFELNAMKDKFFSIIGHDLKNPVSVIKGFVDLLQDGFGELDDERKKKYIGHISKTVDKTSDLLDNLLNWAKSQSGGLKVQPDNLNLHLLIQNTLIFFKETAARKNIHLLTDLDDTHIFAFADRNMTDTVIRNLISNAIKFTQSGGTISIGSEKYKENKQILIWVKDNGQGIKPELTDKLFRIDTNFSTTGTDGEVGTGLGLILCKEFIERNNGIIWLESEEGKGSTFYFTLPKSKEL
jgi:signal transduction histidine kinase/ligand-binding sensor domain-containing protein